MKKFGRRTVLQLNESKSEKKVEKPGTYWRIELYLRVSLLFVFFYFAYFFLLLQFDDFGRFICISSNWPIKLCLYE